MLSNEKIDSIFDPRDGAMQGLGEMARRFARRVESAATAPLLARIEEQDALIAKLRIEAQIHAQEARTANATIAEIYQLCSGGTGEPGNWNGAAPVKARIAELEQQLADARKQMEAQKDEWLSWEAKCKDLEQDAEMLDWLDKQNADIENDAWVVLAHDCAGDEDCKKYWVGADLRAAIRAAIKEQT